MGKVDLGTFPLATVTDGCKDMNLLEFFIEIKDVVNLDISMNFAIMSSFNFLFCKVNLNIYIFCLVP